MPIKHLSFDCWNTLIRPNPAHRAARTEYILDTFTKPSASRRDDAREEVNAAFKYVGEFSDNLGETLGRGLTPKEMVYMLLYRLNPHMKPSEGEVNKVRNVFSGLFREEPAFLLDDDLPELLRDLSLGRVLSVSLICNTGYASGDDLRWLFQHRGIYRHFNFYLFSDETGFFKPNPLFFDLIKSKVRSEFNVYPSEVLHIGDHPICDVKGAQDAGMQALLFDPKRKNYLDIYRILSDKVPCP
jgi:putative hydrolase of the HAD superfamily